MKYLLDTNVISELRKPRPEKKVKNFIDSLPQSSLYLCSLTLGEISFGIEKLPQGRKKHELLIWFYTQLPDWFKGRVIPLDGEAMISWGKMIAQTKRTLQYKDSFIAAAAINSGCILVTRNSKDFADIEGLRVINPWE